MANTGARARCGCRLAQVVPASTNSMTTPSSTPLEPISGALAGSLPRRPAIEGAIVLTLTVNGVGVPLTAGLEGAGVQVARVGAPLQVRFTVPVKPLEGETSRL